MAAHVHQPRPEGRCYLLPSAGDTKRDEVAREILSYLLHNPRAADSFEGIAHWRLLEEIARRSVASTEEAMHWLIANGYLREEKIRAGKIIYRLNSDRRHEIELMVRGHESGKAQTPGADSAVDPAADKNQES